jgi:hypothetical protein
MTGIASVKEAEFETSLINELKRLGASVIPQFRVPGTRNIVDVYIASPVRAFVEIKLRESPILSDVERSLSQLGHLRREFGGEIVPILIVRGEMWRSSSLTQQLQDSGFFILSLNNSTPDLSPAAYCAMEILKFLIRLPYQFKGIEVPAAESSVSPPRPAPSDIHFLQNIDPSIADSISEVLVSFKPVLGAEQFAILEQELSAFSEEYRPVARPEHLATAPDRCRVSKRFRRGTPR